MNFDDAHHGPPRWRYLLLAGLILVVAGAALAMLWHIYEVRPGFLSGTTTPLWPLPPLASLDRLD